MMILVMLCFVISLHYFAMHYNVTWEELDQTGKISRFVFCLLCLMFYDDFFY